MLASGHSTVMSPEYRDVCVWPTALGYRKDLQTRAAVIEVLTKILQQGTEFNMLAETVLADRCGDTLGY